MEQGHVEVIQDLADLSEEQEDHSQELLQTLEHVKVEVKDSCFMEEAPQSVHLKSHDGSSPSMTLPDLAS